MNRIKIRLFFLILIFIVNSSLSFALNTSNKKTINFWPIYYSSVSDDEKELQVMAPIYSSITTPERELTAFRPFYSTDKTENDLIIEKDINILWPFCIHHYKKILTEIDDPEKIIEKKYLLINPIYYKSKSVCAAYTAKRLIVLPFIFSKYVNDDKNYFIIFPFYWNAKNSTMVIPIFWHSEKDSFAIVPFYGKFYDLFDNKETVFYLWPLYVHSENGETNKYYFPFPFVSLTEGGGKSGFKIWPLFGYFSDQGNDGEKRLFYLWPLGFWNKTKINTDDPDHFQAFFPFYWDIKSGESYSKTKFPFFVNSGFPGQKSTTSFWPVFTVITNTKENFKEHRILSFMFRYKKGENENRISVFPFYSVDEKTDKTNKYILWPIYMTFDKKSDKIISKNKYIVPFYFTKYKKEIKTGREENKTFVLPFYAKRNHFDGSKSLSVLWPLWYDKSDAIDQNYAAFWSIYNRMEKPNGDMQKNYFGKLFIYKKTDEAITKEWNFLFWHKTTEVKSNELLK